MALLFLVIADSDQFRSCMITHHIIPKDLPIYWLVQSPAIITNQINQSAADRGCSDDSKTCKLFSPESVSLCCLPVDAFGPPVFMAEMPQIWGFTSVFFQKKRQNQSLTCNGGLTKHWLFINVIQLYIPQKNQRFVVTVLIQLAIFGALYHQLSGHQFSKENTLRFCISAGFTIHFGLNGLNAHL